jgi:hypothetical protein
MEDAMHFAQIAIAATIVGALSAPALAEDAMMAGGTMSTMKPGEVVTVMGDGHTGTMMADDKMMKDMMKMAKPIDCIMIMTGKDGKTYMVAPTTKAEMAECQKMAM